MTIQDSPQTSQDLSKEYHRKPRFIVTPWHLFADKRLNSRLRGLYSLILEFSDEADGCCRASDKYFMDLFSVSLSQIQKDIKKLEGLKYIKRVTRHVGMKKERKIFALIEERSRKKREPRN